MAGKVKTVGDFVTLQRGITYSGALVGKPGPALLGLGSIEPGGGFRAGHFKTFGGECPPKLMLVPGEIYVALKGATKDGSMVGSVARLPNIVPSGRLTQDTARLDFFERDPETASYLYWILRTPQYRQYCAGRLTGSAAASFSREDFLSYPVPPLNKTSRGIVKLLDAIENKIELNRPVNETLEQMARGLFKSWFVDFDPVRAKAEGRDTGLPKEIADLFPNRFTDSELGEIPKGWEVARLEDIAEVIDCLHAKKPERCQSGRPFLQLANIRDNGLIDMQDTFFVSEVDYQKWISRMEASEGDCVITNVGRVGAVAQIPVGFHAALGRNMTGIRLKTGIPYPTFLIECLLSDAMGEEIERKMDSGTILNALNVRNIPRLRFVRADESVIEQFEYVCRPWRRKMELNLIESHSLASLRDALLPKLISGSLRVTDNEEKTHNQE